MIDIPLFKCRASCYGKISTNPQGKTNYEKYIDAKEKFSKLKEQLSSFKNQECKSAVTIATKSIPDTEYLILELEKVKDKRELSKTCKQYLKEWILNQKYNRKKDFTSKYTDKGLLTEQDGFKVIQDVLFKGFVLRKNTISFEDEYFTGHQDVIIQDFVIDNKSSWNLFTFPIGEVEIPEDDYEGQGRVYMRLAKKDNFLLCYTLNDTPIEIIQDEFSSFCFKAKIIDYNDQQYYEFAKNYIFTLKGLNEIKQFLFSSADTSDFVEVPLEKRLVKFHIERDESIEKDMIQRVIDCREWINENWHKF